MMPKISITPEGAATPVARVIPGPPPRIERRELIEFHNLVLLHEGRTIEVGATGVSLPLNGCLFARRIDMIAFDVDARQFLVYEGMPSLFSPECPRTDPHLFPIAMVMMPSRWGRLWQTVWGWVGGSAHSCGA